MLATHPSYAGRAGGFKPFLIMIFVGANQILKVCRARSLISPNVRASLKIFILGRTSRFQERSAIRAGQFEKWGCHCKLTDLREAAKKLNYDYFIWLDMGAYFVRNPGDPLRVLMESHHCARLFNGERR